MDRAYGAACGAGAEWQFGGRAGGSDQRVRYADRQQAGRRESSPAQTAICGSQRSTPARSPRSIRRPARSRSSRRRLPTPARSGSRRALTATSGSPSSRPTRSARSTRARTRSPSSRSRQPPHSRWPSRPDPNGNMWFTEDGGNKIGEINPTTHAITEFTVPTPSSQPFGIASGPDGNIWFTEKSCEQDRGLQPGDGNDQRVPDADSGGGTQRHLHRPRRHPLVHRAGECCEQRRTHRPHDSRDQRVRHPTPMGDPVVIAPGADGNMWFTEGVGKVGAINAVTKTISELTVPTASSGPVGITPGLGRKPVVHRGRRRQGRFDWGRCAGGRCSMRP